MEKIQQAIERARQQRARVAGRLPATTAAPSGQAAPATVAEGLEAALSAARVIHSSPQHLRAHRMLPGSTDDPRSDVFRKLRTQAVLRLQALGGRSIAVVSARDGEGKSNGARTLVCELLRGVPAAKLVVDCPPLRLTDDPRVVQGYVDGWLSVVEQGRTSRDDVERAAEYLDGTKYLGSLLNPVVESDSHTFHGYC